jgi:hypothetical protein
MPLRSAILVIMFYAAARAFGTTSPIVRGAPRASFVVTRFMSTTEDPTSVVATCQEKIQAALEADNVKVTGVYFCVVFEVLSFLFPCDSPTNKHHMRQVLTTIPMDRTFR